MAPYEERGFKPDDVTPGSGRKVWWQCARVHEWATTVANRSRLRSGCPYCAGQRIAESGSLAALRPEIARLWHPTKNGELLPTGVRPGSNVKAWWLCEANDTHFYFASVRTLTVSLLKNSYDMLQSVRI